MTPAETLLAAMQALRTDRPGDYLFALRQVAGMTAICAVDDQTFSVTCSKDSLALNTAHPPHLHLTTTRATLIALIDGDLALTAAITSRQLHLIGPTAALARLARAQRLFANGAARSRRVQRVFDVFKTPG